MSHLRPAFSFVKNGTKHESAKTAGKQKTGDTKASQSGHHLIHSVKYLPVAGRTGSFPPQSNNRQLKGFLFIPVPHFKTGQNPNLFVIFNFICLFSYKLFYCIFSVISYFSPFLLSYTYVLFAKNALCYVCDSLHFSLLCDLHALIDSIL